MAEIATAEAGAGSGGNPLLSPLAYEAAILAILSDNVDAALSNPTTSTWEDGVHAILSAVRGSAEDAALAIHNRARRNAAVGRGALFPYPGFDDGRDGDERRFGFSDLDLGRALTAIKDRGNDATRDEGRDASALNAPAPVRNSATADATHPHPHPKSKSNQPHLHRRIPGAG